MCVDTLHKGENSDDDDDNISNNNKSAVDGKKPRAVRFEK
jgi:hypothetical protein